MTNKPTKYTIPAALREELLRIALETDVIAEHRGVESWRVAAVSGARWLLRCAAECDDMPRMMNSSLRQIAALAKQMSSRDVEKKELAKQSSDIEKRTKSGEMALELEKFLDEED